MRFCRFSITLVCLCILTYFPGCKQKPSNPDGRLDVSGTITFNGGGFEGAHYCSIVFEPIGDESLVASSTTFNSKTGKYLFTMQDGLKPGKYRVKIAADAFYDKRTNKPITHDTPEFGEYRVVLVPPEYNEESTLEFEVVQGQKNVFDYDVKADIKLP